MRVKVCLKDVLSDSCRIRKSSFEVKFGNISGKQVYSSSENLFKPSQRKDSLGVVLHDPTAYSDRVCYPCVRKIRSLDQLFEFVKAGNTPTFLKTVSLKARNTGYSRERLRGENQKLFELINRAAMGRARFLIYPCFFFSLCAEPNFSLY